MRRFVFKVRLDYLAPEQVEEAFRAYFAVVHRKAKFQWKHGDPEALADMLRAECEAKPDRPRPIGFRP